MYSRKSHLKTSKRFCPKAQGCEERATLGKRLKNSFQPQRGCGFWVFLLSLVIASGPFANAADSVETKLKLAQAHMADAIEKIPATNATIFLYLLDPRDARTYPGQFSTNSDAIFHNYPVLGRAKIVPLEEKTNLLLSLVVGIRANDGAMASCFNPRHGLRVVTASKTNDFVICFECLQGQAFDFEVGEFFLTDRSPWTTFDQFVEKYKLKKAK